MALNFSQEYTTSVAKAYHKHHRLSISAEPLSKQSHRNKNQSHPLAHASIRDVFITENN